MKNENEQILTDDRLNRVSGGEIKDTVDYVLYQGEKLITVIWETVAGMANKPEEK